MTASRPVFEPHQTEVTGRRVAAHVIDLVIVGVPLLVVEEIAEALDTWAVYGVIFVFTYVMYFGVFQGVMGWTWGKLLVGLRLADARGEPPGAWPATKRSLTLLVEMVGVIGLIAALTSPWRQRGGDRWAGTYVIGRLDR